MISVVGGGLQKVWMPMKPGVTIYVGSLVCIDFSALDEGVMVRPVAAGASNTTNKDRPLGIVVGTNRRTPVWSSTYNAEYITDAGATGVRADTTEYVGVEGPWAKGNNLAMVEVQLICETTVLHAPIRNNAIGTAITEVVSASGNANGLTVTTDATDFTPVANVCTIYARSGVNAGQYRVTNDTSTTVAAWDRQMLKTTAAVGEKYVRVPIRPIGVSYVTIGDGTVASYVDGSVTPATHYDIIHVHRLDLSEPGLEYVEFTFDADNFCQARA
jgi:hypothetical protein